jgi:hypothetical protein
VRSRSEETATTKVDLHEFAPGLQEYLGRSGYVQLTLFENLGRVISTAPTTAAKTELSRAVELSIAKHRAIVAELAGLGLDPADAMEPYTDGIDEFERVTRGSDWYENLLTCYLSAGFLDEFFAALATGVDDDRARRIAALLRGESGEALLLAELAAGIDESPRLASRLALWGRRLVGDIMLVARSSLQLNRDRSEEARIEPVFTELIAAHTRRMDALGLSA